MATGASVDVVGTDTGASVTVGATGASVDRSKLNWVSCSLRVLVASSPPKPKKGS